jgi:hypothetical protein
METIVTRAPESPRRSWRTVAAAIAIGIAVLVAFAAVDGLVRDPATIDEVRIVNRSDDLVDVLVRTDDGSLVQVTLVDPRSRAAAHDVVDQGDDWTFVVRVSDRTVDEIHLTRAELARTDWTVTVPARG